MRHSNHKMPALLTVREVATTLRISDETVRRRVNDGTLRGVRFGGIMRVPAVELERVLDPETVSGPRP